MEGRNARAVHSGGCETLQDAFAKGLGLQRRGAGQDDGELFAADSRCKVVEAHGGLQLGGKA